MGIRFPEIKDTGMELLQIQGRRGKMSAVPTHGDLKDHKTSVSEDWGRGGVIGDIWECLLRGVT